MKCGRTLQQELPTKSLWHSRIFGEGEEDPYAPNQFNISGRPPLCSSEFKRQEEDCESCAVIRMKLELSGAITLRGALPHVASLLRLELDPEFVPTLVVNVGSTEITVMVQDFETNPELEQESQKLPFRFLTAFA